MKNFKRNANGITLVALVVTIVILIILATVSIGAILGDNGLINMATKSKDEHEQAADKEQELLNTSVSYIDTMGKQDGEGTGGGSQEGTGGETGGKYTVRELKVMETPLTVDATSGWYTDLFKDSRPETRTISLSDYKTVNVLQDDSDHKTINPIFTSSNSVLYPYGSLDELSGWMPGKYWDELPAGYSSNAPFSLEFKTNAEEMIFMALGNIRISVDYDGNGYVVSRPEGYTMGGDTGPNYGYIYVDFGEGKTDFKEIKMESEGGAIGTFIISKDKTIETTDVKKEKILFIGDSWTEGGVIKAGNKYLSYSNIIADRLDMTCINDGIGGTGYNNINGVSDAVPGSDTTIDYSYKARVNKLIPTFNPDVIVISGGLNDLLKKAYEVTEIEEKADSLYALLKDKRSQNPKLKIVIIGVQYFDYEPINQNTIELNEKLIALAQKYQIPYIDLVNGDTYGADGKKITEGTGSYINAGNKGEYMAPEDVHPTKAGHEYLGNTLVTEMQKALNSIK